MDKQKAYALQRELQQFTGSETFYRHSLFRTFIYTEGVKYLAEQAQAYWLLDHIFAHQPELKGERFQVWKIAVCEQGTARITVEDGNDGELTSFDLAYTDFPLDEICLWLVDGTLLLPSEY
jgi:hypothetical protein